MARCDAFVLLKRCMFYEAFVVFDESDRDVYDIGINRAAVNHVRHITYITYQY